MTGPRAESIPRRGRGPTPPEETEPPDLADWDEVALAEVFDWPTEILGDELDAEYGAPTSGGPPYQAWEVLPFRAYGFPSADQVLPTRWSFEDATDD